MVQTPERRTLRLLNSALIDRVMSNELFVDIILYKTCNANSNAKGTFKFKMCFQPFDCENTIEHRDDI